LTQILPTDTIPQYSNLGYSLLGNTLARAYNKSYEDLLFEKIINPLGMINTGVNISTADFNNFATPYLQMHNG